MTTQYNFTKEPPINFPVLQAQINNDPVIVVDCEFMNHDGATNELQVFMAAVLTPTQEARLGAVVAAHNGIMKSFEVVFPLPLFDDFIAADEGSALGWNAQPLNQGTLNLGGQATVDHPGVIRIGTGPLAIGLCSYHLGLKDVRLGGGETQMEFMLRVNTIATGLNSYWFTIGLGDQAQVEANNGVYIAYDPRVSPNWLVKAASQGSRSQFVSSIPVDTGWHRFSLVVSADAALVQFFVDNAYIGELATNIPTAANCGPNVQIFKLLGLTPANVDIDYFYFSKNTGR